MTDVLKRFDEWLDGTGPAALVLREPLMPVEGHDGVVFPATFAATEDKTFKGGYNIDEFPDGSNICLIDSVGSQANRIEPIFAEEPYKALVPQVVITMKTKQVNLLEAGHRAGDAVVRCSGLRDELKAAFLAVMAGNAEPLARTAPTSLVFGAWDSRDTQAKLPRLLASTVRAFNVRRLTRSAQYVPAVGYVDEGLLDEPENKATSDAYAQRGFVHVPSSAAPGGVVALGGIRRDATLHLGALRLLGVAGDETKTRALRRYILGLALTAFTSPSTGYLRQGCTLVSDPDKVRECVAVFGDGRREPLTVSHLEAIAYAQAAAKAFVVRESRTLPFDTEQAKAEVAPQEKKPKKAVKDDAAQQEKTKKATKAKAK